MVCTPIRTPLHFSTKWTARRQDGVSIHAATLLGCLPWLENGAAAKLSDKQWGAGAQAAGAGAPRWSPVVMPSIIVSVLGDLVLRGLPQQPLVFRPHLLTLSGAVCRYPSYPSHGPIAGSRLNSQSMSAAQPVEGGNDLVPLPALLCDRLEWVFQVSYAGFSSTPTRVFSNFSVRPRRNRHTGRQDCLGKWAQRPGEFQDRWGSPWGGEDSSDGLVTDRCGFGVRELQPPLPSPRRPRRMRDVEHCCATDVVLRLFVAMVVASWRLLRNLWKLERRCKDHPWQRCRCFPILGADIGRLVLSAVFLSTVSAHYTFTWNDTSSKREAPVFPPNNSTSQQCHSFASLSTMHLGMPAPVIDPMMNTNLPRLPAAYPNNPSFTFSKRI